MTAGFFVYLGFAALMVLLVMLMGMRFVKQYTRLYNGMMDIRARKMQTEVEFLTTPTAVNFFVYGLSTLLAVAVGAIAEPFVIILCTILQTAVFGFIVWGIVMSCLVKGELVRKRPYYVVKGWVKNLFRVFIPGLFFLFMIVMPLGCYVATQGWDTWKNLGMHTKHRYIDTGMGTAYSSWDYQTTWFGFDPDEDGEKDWSEDELSTPIIEDEDIPVDEEYWKD